MARALLLKLDMKKRSDQTGGLKIRKQRSRAGRRRRIPGEDWWTFGADFLCAVTSGSRQVEDPTPGVIGIRTFQLEFV